MSTGCMDIEQVMPPEREPSQEETYLAWRAVEMDRLTDYNCDKSLGSYYSLDILPQVMQPEPSREGIYSVSRAFEMDLPIIGNNRKKSQSSIDILAKVFHILKSKIPDPRGPFWNWTFLILCVIAIFLDPLFLYIPVINDEKKCLGLDRRLGNLAIALRSFMDFFHLIYIFFQLRTDPLASCLPYRRRPRFKLNHRAPANANKYLRRFFPVDLLSILPLPQVIIFKPRNAMKLLHFFVTFQYMPRLIRIYPVFQKVKTTFYQIDDATFTKAAFNLLLYMLASQIYLQSKLARSEEMRLKERVIEEWPGFKRLPEKLRRGITRHRRLRCREIGGGDVESSLDNLPKGFRKSTKSALSLKLLMKVPIFEKMDRQFLDEVCNLLKTELYTEEMEIVRKGDPVEEMHFVMRGELLSMATEGGGTNLVNSYTISKGNFFGQNLISWALDARFSTNDLPISTRTVSARTEVEAYVLTADDMKLVASKLCKRLSRTQLQHAFRYYSDEWRTWAACFIQAAWRRYTEKKREKSVSMERNRHDEWLRTGGISSSSGASHHTSQLSLNSVLVNRCNGNQIITETIPPTQKPAEPCFTD